jgi:hypothetical protein
MMIPPHSLSLPVVAPFPCLPKGRGGREGPQQNTTSVCVHSIVAVGFDQDSPSTDILQPSDLTTSEAEVQDVGISGV